MLNHFDTVHACDRWTGTDRMAVARTAFASWSKKHKWHNWSQSAS